MMIAFRVSTLILFVQELEYAQRLRRYHESWFTRTFADLMLRRRLREIEVIKVAATRHALDTFKDLGLNSSAAQAERLLSVMKNPRDIGVQDYAEMTQALSDRIIDETDMQKFFMIPPHKAAIYDGAPTLFGEQVNAAFRTAQADIEHAAKCYAFGRATATVFHCMRVMEVALRALGSSLNDSDLDPKKNPSWEAILRRCDEELKVPLEDRSGEWREDDQFYSNATANLRAVKDAWRNPTMHVERDYGDDEALEILNAVKAFMKHLAKKCRSN